MKKLKKPVVLLAVLALVFGLTACGEATDPEVSPDITNSPEVSAPSETPDADEASTPESDASDGTEAGQPQLPTVDPSGAQINIPEQIDSIVVLAPSLAEMVTALGHGDQIVAYDTASVGLEGLPADVPVLDTVTPDMEQLMALSPDVLMVTNLSLYDQESPYQQLIDNGVCVVCVPTSDSIADIQDDIAFVAAVLGETAKGESLIADMQAEVDRIAAIAATITEKKTVYFEISAAPYMYSFGTGVFLNEMIELIGAENILADQEGWLSVGEESVVAADPDVILTNVNYIDDPVQEIKDRSGWDALTAVKDGNVYYIDNMASSLPNQNVVKALKQMAEAIYPEYYGE